MKFSLINRKWIQIALHTAAWLIVLALPYLLRSPYDVNRRQDPDSSGFFYLNTLTDLLWIGIFYLNAYYLVRRLIYRRKYLLYSLVLIGIYCVVMVAHSLLFVLLIHSHPFILINSIGFNLPAFVLALAVSTTYIMLTDKASSDKLVQEKHEENLKTELSFLRSQISPHFIFNVLNNMVALVRLKSDELEPTIMKLSSLMQYMLYETDEEKVFLKDEVEYLQSYIDLQQQRFGKKLELKVCLEKNTVNHEIEPMLLIPFVENAFKHGVGLIENPRIEIQLQVKDNVLDFSVKNKFNSKSKETKDKTSGIGLTNVKRRLNLLYGGQHTLDIHQEQDFFSVHLKLKFH